MAGLAEGGDGGWLYHQITQSQGAIAVLRRHRAGADALLAEPTATPPFFRAPLPPVPEEGRALLPLDELAAFFHHPSAYLLRRRLELWPELREDALSGREPLALDGLERHRVAAPLLDRRLAGEPFEAIRPAVRASGVLPPGTAGDCVLDDLDGSVEPLVTAVTAWGSQDERSPLAVDLALGETRLVGVLGVVPGRGLLRHDYGRVTAPRQMRSWIAHLALDATAAPGLPRESVLVGRPSKGEGVCVVRFGPVEDARSLLAELVDLYWRGMEAPLCLFPRSSAVYAETFRQARAPDDTARDEKAMAAARARWLGGFAQSSEGQEPAHRHVFGDRDPLAPDFAPFDMPLPADERFSALALRVYGPLLDHRDVDPPTPGGEG